MFMFYFIPCKKNVQLLTTLFSVYSQSFLKDVLSESSSFKIRSEKSNQTSVALLGGRWRSDHVFPCLQKLWDQISSVKKAKMQTVKKWLAIKLTSSNR